MMVRSALNADLKKKGFERDPLSERWLDMAKETLLTLADECSFLPLGCDKKLVVAENFRFLSSGKAAKDLLKGDDDGPFLEFLRHPDPAIEVYLLTYSSELDEKGEFFRALIEGGGRHVRVKEFDAASWGDYMDRYFRKRGGSIAPDARDELLRRINGDFAAFQNEAAKLLAHSDGRKTTADDVRDLTPEPLESSTLAIKDALFENRTGDALHIFRDLRVQGVDVVRMIHSLGTQMVVQSAANHLFARGADKWEVSKSLGISPGYAGQLLYRARSLDEEAFGKEILRLYECERAIFFDGRDGDEAFEDFLLNFGGAL